MVMIFIVDLNHDVNRRFKSLDLNQIHPVLQQLQSMQLSIFPNFVHCN